MNLLHGKTVISPKERDAVLLSLEEALLVTLQRSTLTAEMVVNACDKLSEMAGKEHVALLEKAGVPSDKAAQYISEAKYMLRRENLIKRLKIELGDEWFMQKELLMPMANGQTIKNILMPLGVLFHIVAGNQFGLAFYSVIEGLLAGNINLVKLPSGDDGISGFILSELIKLEPLLQDYIYVFDYTSKDTKAIRKLTELTDAVVVWGGDETIQSIRSMAKPNTRIIEWGHKLSFAYVTPAGMELQMLQGIAYNIVTSNQLLCSSCQGIYLETDSMDQVYQFCEQFLPVLEQSNAIYGVPLPIEVQAQTGLQVYTEKLKASRRPSRVFQGAETALLTYEDSSLCAAIPFGNCWVKRLPRDKLLPVLRPHKNHLQTAGLLCAKEERDELTGLLWRAGVVRVMHGENMSASYCGEAHDGDYPILRYSRIVSVEE